MAGRGPLPKTQHQRPRNDRRAQASLQTISPDGEIRGPELGPGFRPETVEWWGTWRRSPQAQLFAETDWQTLRVGAMLVERFYAAPTAAGATEIRLLGERFGATFVDRQRARIVIESDAPMQGPGDVASLAAQRRRNAEARLRGDAS